MKLRSLLTSLFILGAIVFAVAQDAAEAPKNWFLLDPTTDNYPGVSAAKTYEQLLKNKNGQKVIVAVIDSGVDAEHEDLKDIMWVNRDEIPGNGIDDDNNGYIDDIHGWNFIGGKNGKNINQDALEISRLAAHYKKKFDGKDVSKLNKKEKAKYDKYQDITKKIEEKKSNLAQQSMGVMMAVEGFKQVKEHIKKDSFTKEDLDAIETDDEALTQSIGILQNILSRGMSVAELEEGLNEAAEYFDNQINYYYNPDFDPRAEIVGDNYANSSEKYYGNNDVQGPDANHGTHVAGIIAAVRNNDVGMDGIADNVEIMSVRCVPDGDERDKDVANSIRYAVDNGASVINMSFGKSYVWDKGIVDEAVKYAMKKDVLLVHAAGNDGNNTDVENNFPNDKFKKRGFLGLFGKKYAKNWIEVGALNWKGGEDMAASFSNYGETNVDVFAPGVAIYSTTVGDQYDSYPGTSMASPMVAGVAALLRSYYPSLTAEQVKEIIMGSSVKNNSTVKQPGSDEMVPFNKLSVSGGMLSAYEAVKMAEKTKGKKKVKASNVARP